MPSVGWEVVIPCVSFLLTWVPHPMHNYKSLPVEGGEREKKHLMEIFHLGNVFACQLATSLQ